MSTDEDILAGRYFHTFTGDTDPANRRIEYQGTIIGRVEPGIYLVELFTWIDGQGSFSRVVTIDEMRDWWIYDNDDHMRFSYEHGAARVFGAHAQRDDG